MLMSINFFLCSLFFLFSLITGCASFDSPPILKPDDSSIGGMVLRSINDWQNMRGIGVTESVKNAIINEYVSSMMNCRVDLQSIDMSAVESYIFHYLDYVQEGGDYSTEFICNPFIEEINRKKNRYGILQIESNLGTAISINNEQFSIGLTSFILMQGEYAIQLRSDGKVICRRSAKISSGGTSRIHCKSSVG